MEKTVKQVTILITGITGFVGFNLSKRLLNENQNFRIVGIDKIGNNERTKILNNLKIDGRLKIHQINILDVKQVDSLLKKFQPSIIIHLAAKTGVRDYENNEKEYILNNINGTEVILQIHHQILFYNEDVYLNDDE